jgi:hypothetical protein
LLIAGDGLLQSGHLILRDIMSEIPALLPRLVLVIRPLGALTDDTELAALHLLNLGDLLQEGLRVHESVHRVYL